MIRKTFATLLALMAVLGALFVSAERITFISREAPECPPEVLLARIQQNAELTVVDVRTMTEFERDPGPLEDAIHIPLQELERRLDELQDYRNYEIVVLCPNGNRSSVAVRKLRKAGYDAMTLAGGLEALTLLENI